MHPSMFTLFVTVVVVGFFYAHTNIYCKDFFAFLCIYWLPPWECLATVLSQT